MFQIDTEIADQHLLFVHLIEERDSPVRGDPSRIGPVCPGKAREARASAASIVTNHRDRKRVAAFFGIRPAGTNSPSVRALSSCDGIVCVLSWCCRNPAVSRALRATTTSLSRLNRQPRQNNYSAAV